MWDEYYKSSSLRWPFSLTLVHSINNENNYHCCLSFLLGWVSLSRYSSWCFRCYYSPPLRSPPVVLRHLANLCDGKEIIDTRKEKGVWPARRWFGNTTKKSKIQWQQFFFFLFFQDYIYCDNDMKRWSEFNVSQLFFPCPCRVLLVPYWVLIGLSH